MVRNDAALSFELIFIDDGSRTQTRNYLRDLQKQNDEVKLVFLSRNFGEQSAIAAGLAHASGDSVVNMDSDLQDPPELLPQMLAYWRQGYDVVYTRQVNRREPLSKRLPAFLFYRLLNSISEISIPHDAGEFRLMSRPVVDALNKLPEKTRFLRGLVPWVGFKSKEIPFVREIRQSGQSGYTLRKLVKLALDAIVAFSAAPLYLIGWLGALVLTIALGNIAYLMLNPQAAALTATSNLLLCELGVFAGVQLLALGIIAVYVARLIGEIRGRPTYIVAETVGFENERAAAGPSQKILVASAACEVEPNRFLKVIE